MRTPVTQRVQKRRDAAGCWIAPGADMGSGYASPLFDDECRRQSRAIAAADAADRDLDAFMDAALADLDDEADT